MNGINEELLPPSSAGTIAVDAVKPLAVGVYKVDNRELDYSPLAFCKKHSIEERREMATRVSTVKPGCYCVVIHLAPTVTKHLQAHVNKTYVRLIMPPTASMSELTIHARRLFDKELPEDSGVFLYVCVDKAVTRIVSLQAKVSEYVEKAKGADGILHFIATVEAVFG